MDSLKLNSFKPAVQARPLAFVCIGPVSPVKLGMEGMIDRNRIFPAVPAVASFYLLVCHLRYHDHGKWLCQANLWLTKILYVTSSITYIDKIIKQGYFK